MFCRNNENKINQAHYDMQMRRQYNNVHNNSSFDMYGGRQSGRGYGSPRRAYGSPRRAGGNYSPGPRGGYGGRGSPMNRGGPGPGNYMGGAPTGTKVNGADPYDTIN